MRQNSSALHIPAQARCTVVLSAARLKSWCNITARWANDDHSHWRGQRTCGISRIHCCKSGGRKISFGKSGWKPSNGRCFSDDVMGLPEDILMQKARLVYPPRSTSAQRDTQRVWNRAAQALVEANAYSWLFGVSDYAAAPPSDSSTAGCTRQMREWCQPARQRLPLLMGLHGHCCGLGYSGNGLLTNCERHSINFTLAAFLIVRPPHGYIGSGWLGCDAAGQPPVHTWEALFDLDVGEPRDLCHELSPGIFRRSWSKGSVQLDCNTFHPTLNFSLKPD